MSFPRYPKYKDSGVEWLGKVPDHWLITKTKHVVHFTTGWTPPTGDATSFEGDNLWANISDLGPKYISDTSKRISDGAVIASRIKPSPKGSLLFSFKLSIGQVSITGQDMFTNEAIATFLPSSKMCVGYAYYAFPIFLIQNAAENIYGAKLLNQELIRSASFALPNLTEQTQIATFLDRETAKIDGLVTEQQRLIGFLKEKRRAVISHAVTKGLNPNALMKSSGTEWLGDIPKHWEVKRLKHISPFITVGIVVNPSTFVSEEGFPFIYGGDIREGVIDWEHSRRIDANSSEENSKTKLGAGDLLTVRVGAPGVTAVVPLECEGGNCASVMLIRQGPFNSHWLCYAMNTRVVRFQVEVVQYGAAQEQFNISHAVNFFTPAPPRTEQDKIVEFLGAETARFDALTREVEDAIDLLQERRTSLISDAVTGRIDVRNTAAKEAA